MRHALLTVLILFSCSAHFVSAAEAVRLVSSPAVSPDGKQIAFSWRGDVWSASIDGGKVEQLTQHTSRDGEPRFSPDGKQIAFISERTGSRQLFRMFQQDIVGHVDHCLRIGNFFLQQCVSAAVRC